jgi:8-hydroxy-5-deazaflavin:NADPH oxidoreductase
MDFSLRANSLFPKQLRMKKIGILGSGAVGRTLSEGFVKHGYEVMLGTGDVNKLSDWQSGVSGKVGSFERAADFGDLIVLAVKGSAALTIVEKVKSSLSGKTVLDTTNPIAESLGKDGVLQFFTGPEESLMEILQDAAPEAHFVKAFSYVSSSSMVNPKIKPKPKMLICGNDAEAKAEVKKILDQFGFKTEDLGVVTGAREIETMALTA